MSTSCSLGGPWPDDLAHYPALGHRTPLAAVDAHFPVVSHEEQVASLDSHLPRQVANAATLVRPGVNLRDALSVEIGGAVDDFHAVFGSGHYASYIDERRPLWRSPRAYRPTRMANAAGTIVGAGRRASDHHITPAQGVRLAIVL